LFLPGFSVASVQFKDRGGEEFIVVGTARSLALHPTTHRGGRLRVYRYLKHKLMLVHTTDIEGECYDWILHLFTNTFALFKVDLD
jgi:splicing factor 3B subunit 3